MDPDFGSRGYAQSSDDQREQVKNGVKRVYHVYDVKDGTQLGCSLFDSSTYFYSVVYNVSDQPDFQFMTWADWLNKCYAPFLDGAPLCCEFPCVGLERIVVSSSQ